MFVKLESINQNIKKDAALFIAQSDKTYSDNICELAKSIIATKNKKPIVIISGPSGSGKTTTAHILDAYLESAGIVTHTLSVDDYFYPMTDKEKELHRQNKLNLEGPERVDSELLNRQLRDIMNCKQVCLPKFDFTTNSREISEVPIARRQGEIVIIEGTHALNPDVISLPDENTVRVYVSVRTRVKTEDGEMIHPEYIRLIRRMLRDKLFRDRSFTDTARMYHKVQDGENKYIMPFKKRSSFDIDTFIPYELNVYRDLVYEGLVKEDIAGQFPQLISLIKDAYPLDRKYITSKNTLINEFLG